MVGSPGRSLPGCPGNVDLLSGRGCAFGGPAGGAGSKPCSRPDPRGTTYERNTHRFGRSRVRGGSGEGTGYDLRAGRGLRAFGGRRAGSRTAVGGYPILVEIAS